ncbi:MAG: glycosyltransferase [Saprospiraceae bacterium]|nr:glycosyltransferase [Saprospiraceae bacterium]
MIFAKLWASEVFSGHLVLLAFVWIAGIRVLWLLLNVVANKKAWRDTSEVLQKLLSVFPKVSIIVAAKNEVRGLQKLLPSLLSQDYPNFEVIIIDDFSEDDSQMYLSSIRDSRLKIVSCTKDLPGKKQALKEGIGQAIGKYLLFTDADCFPVSGNWVRSMVKVAENRSSVVLGHGPFERRTGLSGLVSRTDALDILRQYTTAAVLGMPYMGVGRNMMYQKSDWEKAGGFKSHEHFMAGDDDLQIQYMAKDQQMTVCASKEALVYSPPKPTIFEFIKQKTRHIRVSTAYTAKSKVMAGIDPLLRTLFYASFLVAVFLNLSTALWIWVSFMLLSCLILALLFRKFDETALAIFYPLTDFILFCLYPIIFVLSRLKKDMTWK